jgi:hypothetical protein
MVGNQGETWETIKESSDFINSLNNLTFDFNNISRLQIYPNTEVYKLAKEKGIIDDSFWLSEKPVPNYTAEYSEGELMKMNLYILARYKMHKGIFSFLAFSLKWFIRDPMKGLRYLSKMVIK